MNRPSTAPVPVNPQPLAVLRARLPAALRPTYNAVDFERNQRSTVGTKPEHVFDSLDGIRLIISHDRDGTGPVFLHVSASFFMDHWAAFAKMMPANDGLRVMVKEIQRRSEELMDRPLTLKDYCVTPNGVIHLLFENTGESSDGTSQKGQNAL